MKLLLTNISAKYNNLASVLIVDKRTINFRDVWRHKSNLTIQVHINEYLRFLNNDKNICKYLTIQTYDRVINKVLNQIYPYFVQDVVIAQVFEIMQAENNNLKATKITFETSQKFIKRLQSKDLQKYRKIGYKAIYKFLYNKDIQLPTNISDYNIERYIYCLVCYGYATYAIENNIPYIWTVN